MTEWTTIQAYAEVTLLVPFTLTVDSEQRAEMGNLDRWVESYNRGDRPDDLESADVPWADAQTHEVIDFKISDAEEVRGDGS